MSESVNTPSVDMIRWTFSVPPESREPIEAYLTDLGLDIVVIGEGQFHVTWEEPERDMSEVVSELWDLTDEPFEITQEEFHKLGQFLIHPEETEDAQQAA